MGVFHVFKIEQMVLNFKKHMQILSTYKNLL